MGKAFRGVAKGVGYAWATPTAFISFIFFIGPALLTRQLWWGGWYGGALEFMFRDDSWLDRKYGNKFSAICLGWTITYTKQGFTSRYCMLHERAHVAQQWVLGPFYLPLWFIFHGIFGYRLNPFEVHACEWGRDFVYRNNPLFNVEDQPIPLPDQKKVIYLPASMETSEKTPLFPVGLCPECDFPNDNHNLEFTNDKGEHFPTGSFVFIDGIGMVEHAECIAMKKADDEKLQMAAASGTIPVER